MSSIVDTANDSNVTWLGEWPEDYWIGNYVDSALLLIFGGIPWQVRNIHVLRSPSMCAIVLLDRITKALILVNIIGSVLFRMC